MLPGTKTWGNEQSFETKTTQFSNFQVENCKRLGAKVVIYGGNFGEAKKRALAIGQKKGLLYVNG